MPESIIITKPQVQRVGDRVTVNADYLRDDGAGQMMLLHRASFRFEWRGPFSLAGGEAFVTLGLLPAMKLGLPMFSEAPVAPGFLDRMKCLMEIIMAWFGDGLTRVELSASAERPIETGKRGVAAFFSCGVDSFHTVDKRRSELTHLLFIDGFDVDLHQVEHRLLARANAQEAAGEMGLPLVIIETDARLFLDRYVGWKISGGTVVGAVAQLFVSVIDQAILAASHLWQENHQNSDAYMFASQFNLADLDFCLDGLNLCRAGKIADLGDCAPFFRHLRVCWEMPLDRLNCGSCEKCLRTIVSMNAVGLISKCESLPSFVDWQKVASVEIRLTSVLRMWDEIRRITVEPKARAMLDDLVFKFEANQWSLRLWELGKEMAQEKGWSVLGRKLGKSMLGATWRHDRIWYLKKCHQHLGQLRERLFAIADRRSAKESGGDKSKSQPISSTRP
ncbi:MAG: hypothetical protein QE570_09970 [Verrucomicrobiota bacterium]|nr:hypothetical protein [Verrucomicrobiota bacterium]